jgi:hypothetical protein
VIVLVAVATVTILALVSMPARAGLNPGWWRFLRTCHCRVVTAAGAIDMDVNTQADRPLAPVNISLNENASVLLAYIGFQTEPHPIVRPMQNSRPTAAVSVNGIARGGLPDGTGRDHSINTPNGGRARMQYFDATELVQKYGSGSYQITNNFANVPGQIQSFMLVVLDNPNWPMSQVAINDFFYASSTVPESMQINTTSQLPAVPADYWYASGQATLTVLGGSWQVDDFQNANYVMGSARGALTNNNSTSANAQSFFGSNRWGVSKIPNLDLSSRNFTLNVNITQNPGLEDSSSWMIFQAPLETNAPPPPPPPPPPPVSPEIKTDTCYDED